jgi:hypothetical protein
MSYITGRIIAMAYPSGAKTNFWRNLRGKLINFFKHKHSGNVKIYNLCIEPGFRIDDAYNKGMKYLTNNYIDFPNTL